MAITRKSAIQIAAARWAAAFDAVAKADDRRERYDETQEALETAECELYEAVMQAKRLQS